MVLTLGTIHLLSVHKIDHIAWLQLLSFIFGNSVNVSSRNFIYPDRGQLQIFQLLIKYFFAIVFFLPQMFANKPGLFPLLIKAYFYQHTAGQLLPWSTMIPALPLDCRLHNA